MCQQMVFQRLYLMPLRWLLLLLLLLLLFHP
jgi:hypothetical protein